MSATTSVSVNNGYQEWAVQRHKDTEADKYLQLDQPKDMFKYLSNLPYSPVSIPVYIMKVQADRLWSQGEYEAANLLYAKAAENLYKEFGNTIEGHDVINVNGEMMSLGALVQQAVADSLDATRDLVNNMDLRSTDDLTVLLSLLNGSLTPDELEKINDIKEKYSTTTDGGLAQSQMNAEINDVLVGAMERINAEAADLGLDPVFSEGFILDFTEVTSSETGSAIGGVFIAINNLFEAIASGDESEISKAYVDLQNAKTLLEDFRKKQADAEKAA